MFLPDGQTRWGRGGTGGKGGGGGRLGLVITFAAKKKKKNQIKLSPPPPNCIPIAKPDDDYFLRLIKRKPSDQVRRWGHLPGWEDPEKRDLKSRFDFFF